MSNDPLDMSTFLAHWSPNDYADGFAKLRADGSRPITLDFKATNVEPSAEGKILIMQARRKGEELWAIRMITTGRLLIQPGTGPSRESLYGYPGEVAMGVSFNPVAGTLSVVIRDGGLLDREPVESFNLLPHTPWAFGEEDYEILIGAPEGYADLSPLGWRIDCSFRYGPKCPTEDPVLGAEEPWAAREAQALVNAHNTWKEGR